MSNGHSLTFKQIAASDTYQAEAQNWAKTHIFISFAVAIATTVLGPASLGMSWFWVVFALPFGVSFLVALPTMVVYVYLAVLQSRHSEPGSNWKPHPIDNIGRMLAIVKPAWSLVSIALAGIGTYQFIIWIGT